MEIPLHIFDAIVAMRYAQLQEEGNIELIESHAINTCSGRSDSFALQRKHGRNPSLDFLQLIK